MNPDILRPKDDSASVLLQNTEKPSVASQRFMADPAASCKGVVPPPDGASPPGSSVLQFPMQQQVFLPVSPAAVSLPSVPAPSTSVDLLQGSANPLNLGNTQMDSLLNALRMNTLDGSISTQTSSWILPCETVNPSLGMSLSVGTATSADEIGRLPTSPTSNVANTVVSPKSDSASGTSSTVTAALQQQHRQLAEAAATAQQVVGQKIAEQQAAAASYNAAVTTATVSLDPTQRSQATAQAHMAHAMYKSAGKEAAAAQDLASRIQNTLGPSTQLIAAQRDSERMQATIAATSDQGSMAYQTTMGSGNLTPVNLLQTSGQQTTQLGNQINQLAADAASMATSFALMQQAQQGIPMMPGLSPGLQASQTQSMAPASAIAAAPLVQAASTAKQMAAQKHMETHAAAVAYQTASVQAASTNDPSQKVIATALAQQAALVYQTAANEAASAAAAAHQLEQAATLATQSAAQVTTVAPGVPVPASVALAAHIANGTVLSQPQVAYLSGGSGAGLTSPALTPALGGVGLTAIPSAAVGQQQVFLGAGMGPYFQVPTASFGAPRPTSALSTTSASTLSTLGTGSTLPFQAGSVIPSGGINYATAISNASGLNLGLGSPPAGSGIQGAGANVDFSSQSFSALHRIPAAPAMIKAVCSSGGAFVRTTSGAWDYEGGETRLVSLPFGCTAEALFSTLERATATFSDSSDIRSEYVAVFKYRLPSDPTVWVDLVDDDDVSLMFDEWEEASNDLLARRSGGSSAVATSGGVNLPVRSQAKLHIFVQWRTTSIGDEGSRGGDESQDARRSGLVGVGELSSQQEKYQSTERENDATDNHISGSCGRETAQAEMTGQLEAKFEGEGAAGCDNIHRSGSSYTDGSSGDEAHQEGGLTSNGRGLEIDADGPTSRAGHAQRAIAVRATRRRRRLPVAAIDRAPSQTVDLAGIVERMEIIDPADITLSKFLGSGGYGDVYLGRWHACEVAVKCLNPALFFQGAEPGSINRAAVADLIREADILGSLRHPCVVWVYGLVLPKASASAATEQGSSGTEDLVEAIKKEAGAPSMMPGVLRPPALVTEYMAGGSLKAALARRADIVAGPLTRLVLALDAAKGLEYLHSKRICHFDVKSGNLLLGYRDRRPVCKVADFGLAREKAQTFVSGVTSQRGTLPWTAPEILRSPDAVTEKVDVFSFGIVMWELWTGREPYEGLNYHALMVQLAHPEARLRPPIPGTPEWEGDDVSAPPELAPGWRDLMERCWAEEPTARPPFTQVIKELREMISAIKPQRGGHGGVPRDARNTTGASPRPTSD